MARTKKTKTTGKASAVAKNKMTSPQVKFTDMRAASSERMAVLRAKMGEKMVRLNASMLLAFSKIRHPVNPVKRIAAKERSKEMKQAAKERKKQQVAIAANVASAKRARIREKRAVQMDNVLH